MTRQAKKEIKQALIEACLLCAFTSVMLTLSVIYTRRILNHYLINQVRSVNHAKQYQ